MNGTRQEGYENTLTDLYFQFLKNGIPYSAHKVSKVEIYPSHEDAVNNTNIIQLIPEGDITENVVNIGKYGYTVQPIATAGTFFDKIYIQPESDDTNELTFISPFYIFQKQYGGSTPGSKETAIIYLNVFDIVDSALNRDNVTVNINVDGAWYGNDFIKQKNEKFKINKDGNVVRKEDGKYIEGMKLLETDTMTDDTFPQTGDERIVYYNINICGQVREKFTLPKGTVQANYKDLPKLSSELD